MPNPPSRVPPSHEARQRTMAMRTNSQRGGTGWAGPVAPRAAPNRPSGVIVVIHGDDGTVARPAAALVMWVGAATPANGVDFDFWYPATI